VTICYGAVQASRSATLLLRSDSAQILDHFRRLATSNSQICSLAEAHEFLAAYGEMARDKKHLTAIKRTVTLAFQARSHVAYLSLAGLEKGQAAILQTLSTMALSVDRKAGSFYGGVKLSSAVAHPSAPPLLHLLLRTEHLPLRHHLWWWTSLCFSLAFSPTTRMRPP
jgi:hypothetical protein